MLYANSMILPNESGANLVGNRVSGAKINSAHRDNNMQLNCPVRPLIILDPDTPGPNRPYANAPSLSYILRLCVYCLYNISL